MIKKILNKNNTKDINKANFIKDKSFYKMMLLLAIPVTMQNIIIFLTQMLDTVMLGALGDVAMSAASLANQPFLIFNMVTFGLGSGGAVIMAQYWGKGEKTPIKRIMTLIITISVTAGFISMLVVLLFPEQIMTLFIKDPEVIAAGTEYLKIIAYSYFFFGFSNVFYTSIRSIEAVKVAVISNVIALVINGSLNYLFIFGKFGVPAYGVKGAAMATLIARIVECGIAIVYIFFLDKKIGIKFSDFTKFDKNLAMDTIKVSIPVTLNEVMWALAMTMQAKLLGSMGKDAVAANSIISVVQQLAMVSVFGIASAAAVMIGKAIGSGDMKKARDYGHTFKILSVIGGIAVFTIIILLKDIAVNFYNVEPHTKELAHQMMYVAAVIGFFVAVSATGIVGILRGGGDTKFALYAEAIALWVIAIPLAYFAAFVLHWNVVAVFAIMKIDEPLKSVIVMIRVRGTNWLRDFTRSDVELSE